MARFRGTLDGGRGEVSRLGHKPGGLDVCAQSWSGAVRVRLYVDAEDRDCALVEFVTHHGEGTRATLYDGPVNPERDDGARALRRAGRALVAMADAAEPATAGA